MIRKTLVAAVLLSAALSFSDGARAAPFTPPAFDISAEIIAVKDGCGIGFQRLSSGVCRPQPEGPRLMRLFARKCQLGYRRNLLGKCVKE